ncbi:WecB/TagA/CpsF family glycosyltransferase [Candidatus Woesebacteria bacterium]|nr:WecB/TagA/CpsF family glycosyltransferase [Candidatus Woesebacteria bacterium]
MRKDDKQTHNYDRANVNIFGVNLISTPNEQVLKQVIEKIEENKQFLLFTPNPEILLKALKNKKLQDAINQADIKVADGVGIKIANYYLNQTIGNIRFKNQLFNEFGLYVKSLIKVFTSDKNNEPFPVIKGRELFIDLVTLANKNGWKIFLLGGTGGISKQVEEKLKAKYKSLKVKSGAGPMLDESGKPLTNIDKDIEKKVIEQINEFQPDITFVAFGAPKQELWSSRHLPKLMTKGIMVVGGTFDYISEKEKLPPNWMGERGLEWLWRLITQPRRIGRIFRAVVVFPIQLIWDKYQGKQ